MIRAFFYLRGTTLQNQLLSRVRRLRQPKYLFGAIAGAAYFWFIFFRQTGFKGPPGRGLPPMAEGSDLFPLVFIFGAFVTYALYRVIAAWAAPAAPGLPFTEAEAAFLFPAPLSRRTLIHYKLLSSQLPILFQAALLTLISTRWTFLGGNAGIHALGWWVIFSTLNLHTTGAALTVTRLIAQGVGKLQRQVVVFGLLLLLAAAVAVILWRTAPPLTANDTAHPAALFRYLAGLTRAGPLYWLLLPGRVVVAPFLAQGWREFFLVLGPALLVLAAHYVWVLRSETPFEEGSIAQAEKRGAAVAALKAGTYRLGRGKARLGPFQLASRGGRPEIAFLWKNLLSTQSFFTLRTFVASAGVIVVVCTWLSHGSDAQRSTLSILGVCGVMMAGYALVLGPQLARQDFRGDLGHMDLFKTYPLPGWQVVLGELLAPVAILTGIVWLALLTATLSLGAFRAPVVWLTVEFRTTAALCLAVVLPLLCTLQLMVPNAATLLFPSWTQATRTRDRGLDVMGQRLIFAAGQFFVIALAVLPAAVAGVLLWFAARLLVGEAGSAVIATLGIVLVLGLEIAVGLLCLGWRFEKFDLSSESVK